MSPSRYDSMTESIYTDEKGRYLNNNPTWHTEDSPWKARQILKMIAKNQLPLQSICEIGCGAGEILNQLHQLLPPEVTFTGYEISTDALEFCKERAKDRLEFKMQSLYEIETHYDLLLMIDVFEHVEDYFGLIRAAGEKATYKIFHIPLDITVLAVFRNTLLAPRKSVGHIQYFTKETALATLKDCGLEIIDHFYTPALDLPSSQRTLPSKFFYLPRKILYAINKDFGVRLLGGYSLMVLAK